MTRLAPAPLTRQQDSPVLPPTRRRRPRGWNARAWTYVVLVVASVLTLLPFVWMLLGSFKTQGELLRRPVTWWPEEPTLANYTAWFTDLGIGQFFTNSLVVAVFTVLGNLVFCSMVGYALAKMTFPGKRLLFTLVMITLMVPGVVTFVPLFVMVSQLGLVNTYPGLILPFLVSPLGVFLMRQFMMTIPDDLLDAARIDGASEFGIFCRIVLPLVSPALVTLGLLVWIYQWNEVIWTMTVTRAAPELQTVTVGIHLMRSEFANERDQSIQQAALAVSVVPVIVLFLILQRFYVRGLTMGSLKG